MRRLTCPRFGALLRAIIPWIVLSSARWDGLGAAEVELDPVTNFDAAWRIINESYYDPTFHGLDWNAARTELRPKAEMAKSVQELRPVIQEMLDRLGGSHMSLIPRELAHSLESLRGTNEAPSDAAVERPAPSHAEAGANGKDDQPKKGRASRGEGELGFDIRLVGSKVLVTRVDPDGPGARAGVKMGWEVLAVDQEPVDEMLRSIPPDLKLRDRQFIGWEFVSGKLSGAPGSSSSIQLLDGSDQLVTMRLTRRHEQGQPTKLGFLPTLYPRIESKSLKTPGGASAAWIWFNLWMVPIVQVFDAKIQEFRRADGLVIDMRGNFGGIGGMILGVSGHFLNERISLGTLKLRDNELKFFTNPRRVNPSGERVEPYAGPLAILTDELSLSAAEIFAGGMQSIGRARVFGETSGGQALPAVWDRLPDGDVLYHAVGDFVTANGKRVEGAGVVPDVQVPLTREDLLAGRDAPLLAALRWIDQEKAKREKGDSAIQ